MSNKQNDELSQAVVEAATDYIFNVMAGHHGPNAKATMKSLMNLHAAVNLYEEWELDL